MSTEAFLRTLKQELERWSGFNEVELEARGVSFEYDGADDLYRFRIVPDPVGSPLYPQHIELTETVASAFIPILDELGIHWDWLEKGRLQCRTASGDITLGIDIYLATDPRPPSIS